MGGDHGLQSNPDDGLGCHCRYSVAFGRASGFDLRVSFTGKGVQEDQVDQGSVLAVATAYSARQFDFFSPTDPILGCREWAHGCFADQSRYQLFRPGLWGLRWLGGHLRSRLES